jgi:hypothetical protein
MVVDESALFYFNRLKLYMLPGYVCGSMMTTMAQHM